MIPAACLRHTIALALLAPIGLLAAPGCDSSVAPTETTSVPGSPTDVLEPQPPDTAPETTDTTPPADQGADMPAGDQSFAPPALVEPTDLAQATPADDSVPAASPESDEEVDSVSLIPMSYDDFRAKVATSPDAKLTMVDAWATWCGPCKENFPHLVEMSKKFADKGLKVVSLSMDDPEDPAVIKEAQAFLREQKAEFTNVLLDEENLGGFDKFDFGTIPAVFLYDPTGKEIRRFTYDDPNHQFTYDEVEQVVATLLEGKPLPDDAPGFVYEER